MAARRYTNEIPNRFTLRVFWCQRRDLLCSHSNGDIFTCEDNMLFSLVKISSFRTKAHLVFHWCLYNKSDYDVVHARLVQRLVHITASKIHRVPTDSSVFFLFYSFFCESILHSITSAF